MTVDRPLRPRPALAPLRALAAPILLAALCCIGAWRAPEVASAQRGRPPSARERATSALAQVDLGACAARVEWAGRRARVGLVVLPGGEWGVAITSVMPALPDRDDSALTRCLETALRARLGDSVPLPPREAFVVTADLELPGSPALAIAVDARIDAARAAFDACVRERAEARLARVDVVARVEVRAGRVTEIGSRSDADPYGQIALCIGVALQNVTDLPEGAAVVRATVTRPAAPPGTLARHDGTEGAICAWGDRAESEARGEHVLPDPRPCRPGLMCCYGGGIPGLGSSCMRVARHGCPRYP